MNVLDMLCPERFVEELPFLIESLAIEFPQVRIMISPENLPLVAEDLSLGLAEKPDEETRELESCLGLLLARANDGEAAEIAMSRAAAYAFASDLATGTRLRQGGGKAGASASAI